MKKKLLLVFFAIAICLSIFIGTSVAFASAAESTKIEVYSAEYFSNVNRSVELHEQAVSQYIARTSEHNGKEFTVYSDDFAGAFIDEQGFLNIAVVGKSRQTSKYGEQVIYKQFAFSYNYLQKIMNAIENIMDYYSIRAVGIDDLSNLVFVEMSDEKDIAPIVEYLQRESLYNATAISFEIDPTAQIVENANTAYGGESLYHWVSATTVSRGTICVNAIDNTTGQLGVLTNEHVAPAANNTTMVYGGHFNGTWFNTATTIGKTARGQQGGSIDAAFVPYANQQDWEVTPYGKYDSTTYSNVVLGNNNQIVRGQLIRRLGQTTGITTGEIRSTNTTVTVDGVQITNTFRYTNDGQGGDSGGPVYFDDGANLHLIGIHFASGDVFLGGRQGIACRIQNVMNTLNVTPITNSSFNTTNLSGDGQLVQTPDGSIFLMVGGSPLAISFNFLTNVLGSPQTVRISYATFNCLPQYPADGTYVFDGASIFEFVGGAPLPISNVYWVDIIGIQPCIRVDGWSLMRYSGVGCVRRYPADGTYVYDGGSVYEFVGGAPLGISYVYWVNLMGSHSCVRVDNWSLTRYSGIGSVNQHPADNTYVHTLYGDTYYFITQHAYLDNTWTGHTTLVDTYSLQPYL